MCSTINVGTPGFPLVHKGIKSDPLPRTQKGRPGFYIGASLLHDRLPQRMMAVDQPVVSLVQA